LVPAAIWATGLGTVASYTPLVRSPLFGFIVSWVSFDRSSGVAGAVIE
jgi:hypothetical protein